MNPDQRRSDPADAGSVSLTGLLTERPASRMDEVRIFASLRGPGQPLTTWIRDLLRTGETTTLRAIARDTLPLHTLLHDNVASHVRVTGLDQPFAPNEAAPVNALRAMAFLGLALADDAAFVEDNLSTGMSWLRAANTFIPDGTAWSPTILPVSAHQDRVAHLAEILRRDPHLAAALSWLLHLDDARITRVSGPGMPVLLDSGNRGREATLRLTTTSHLPPLLAPDPQTMSLFSADEDFRRSLANAWAQDGARIDQAVLWSLEDADGPVERVIDRSLGAAFAVLLDELRRTGRPIKGPLTVRRLRSHTAVVGGIDRRGRLEPASGYASKFAAETMATRVVVPASDVAAAQQHAEGRDIEVVAAENYKAAARRCRARDRRALLRLAAVVAAVALVLAGASAGVAFWLQGTVSDQQRTVSEQQREAEARRLLDEAAAQRETDPQLALKLGLAAHQLAPSSATSTSLAGTLAGADHSRRLTGHDTPVTGLSFSPDGRTLATIDDVGTVSLWDTEKLARPVGEPKADDASAVEFAGDGKLLAIGGYDGVGLWDVADPAHPRELGVAAAEGIGTLSALAFAPDGQSLAGVTDDGFVASWDISDSARPRVVDTERAKGADEVIALAFAQDGRTLATVSFAGDMTLWSRTSSGGLSVPTIVSAADLGTVTAVAFNRDADTIAIASDDQQAGGTFALWDIEDPTSPVPIGEPISLSGPVTALAFDPEGDTLATSLGPQVILWDVADPDFVSALVVFEGRGNPVDVLRFSPTGERLASAGGQGSVEVWNTAHPPDFLTLPGIQLVEAAAFGATSVLATGSIEVGETNSRLRLWDIAEPGRPARLGPPLTSPTDFVAEVAYSPNGTTAAAITTQLEEGGDKVALVDTSDPDRPRTIGRPLAGHTGHVDQVVFSADGKTMAISAYSEARKSGSVTLWRTTNPAQPTLVGNLPGDYLPIDLNVTGTILAAATPDPHNGTDSVVLIDTSDPKQSRRISLPETGQNDPVNAIKYGKENILAAASGTGVVLWDVTDPGHPRQLGHTTNPAEVTSIAFDPTQRVLATADKEGRTILWDITEPSNPQQLGEPIISHSDPITSVSFSDDGDTFVTVDEEHATMVWDLTELNEILRNPKNLACDRSGGFTKSEWARYVKVAYEPTCTN
jgi:WD40 repeat protein